MMAESGTGTHRGFLFGPESMKRLSCIATLLLIALLSPGRAAHGQMTSSRNVAVLPLLSASRDSSLAEELYRQMVNIMGSAVVGRNVNLDLVGQALKNHEIAGILSNVTKMGEYSREAGAAFLIGGGLRRQPEGALMVSMAVYGVDDGRVLASRSQSFTDTASAKNGVIKIVRAISKPRVLTPSDTPVFYSIFIPGSGQLMMGKPIHALVCSGLVVWAFLSYRDPTPSNIHPNYRARYEKAVRRARMERVVTTWLINVADAIVLSRLRLQKVDASIFFSMMEHYSSGSEKLRPTPALHLRIRFLK